MTDWNGRFMSLAAQVATWSKDPSTKVGCVIVDDDRLIVGVGYNGFPRGVQDLEERYLDKPTKYRMIVHSEANAILSARTSVRGCTLYCTQTPCTECTKLLIQAGIVRVVAPELSSESTWYEDSKISALMMREATVFYTTFSDRLSEIVEARVVCSRCGQLAETSSTVCLTCASD